MKGDVARKPTLVVLAASAYDAQAFVALMRLGDNFRPRYTAWPQGLRGAHLFVVAPGFEYVQTPEWRDTLAVVRTHAKEFSVAELADLAGDTPR